LAAAVAANGASAWSYEMRDERTHGDHTSSLRRFEGGRRAFHERRKRAGHRGERFGERVGVERAQRLTLRVPRIGDELIERAECGERLVNRMFRSAAFSEIAVHRGAGRAV
jgi:hypothetical protein